MVIIIFFLLVLFLGYRYPKSEKVSLGISAILWILYAFNTYTPDYSAYKQFYDSFSTNLNEYGILTLEEATEPGWAVVMIIPALFHMSFEAFKIFIASVYVLMLYFTVKKYTSNIALAMAIFTVFPFIHSVAAMRFGFAAIVFSLFTAPLATGQKNSKAIALFFLGILIAGSIHYSILILAILFFAYFQLDNRVKYLIVILTVFCFFILKTDIPYNICTSIKLPHLTNLAQTWLTHQSSPGRLSLSMFGTTYALEIYTAVMSSKVCPNSDFAKIVKRMYILSIAFTPFVLITDQFTRLYFAMFPLCIFSAINTIDVLKDNIKEGITLRKLVTSPYIIILPVAALHLFFSNFVYMGTTSDVFYFMSQNYLFNIFNA